MADITISDTDIWALKPFLKEGVEITGCYDGERNEILILTDKDGNKISIKSWSDFGEACLFIS